MKMDGKLIIMNHLKNLKNSIEIEQTFKISIGFIEIKNI